MAENGRTVSHLKSLGSDGMLPALLSEAARDQEKGRAEVIDFFAQLFRSDHGRAQQIRKKMDLDRGRDRRLFADVDRLLEADAFDGAKRRLAGRPLPLGGGEDDAAKPGRTLARKPGKWLRAQ